MHSVRFSQVVAKAGRPTPYVTWSNPEKDAALKRLVREARVMTVHQQLRGARKDFATVGFHREANAQLLVFPRSLRRFAERRVIGIDYQLLADQDHAVGGKTTRAQTNEPAAPGKPRLVGSTLPKKSTPRKLPAVPPKAPASREAILRAVRHAVRELDSGQVDKAGARLRELIGNFSISS